MVQHRDKTPTAFVGILKCWKLRNGLRLGVDRLPSAVRVPQAHNEVFAALPKIDAQVHHAGEISQGNYSAS